MSEALQRLKEQARALNPAERLDLVEDVLANLEDSTEPYLLNGQPKLGTGLRPIARANWPPWGLRTLLARPGDRDNPLPSHCPSRIR